MAKEKEYKKREDYKLPSGYSKVITSITGILKGKFVKLPTTEISPWDRSVVRCRIDVLACGHWVDHSSNFGWPSKALSRKCHQCIDTEHKLEIGYAKEH